MNSRRSTALTWWRDDSMGLRRLHRDETVLTSIATLPHVAGFQRGRREKAIGAEGYRGIVKSVTLSFSAWWKSFPIAVLLFWVVFLTLAAIFFDPEPVGNPDGIWVFAGLLFLSAGLAWIFYIMAIDTHVRADDAGIHYHSLLVPERTIEWSEIQSIRYSAIRDSLGVVGDEHSIWIHSWISDNDHWRDFFQAIFEKVPEDKMQERLGERLQRPTSGQFS